MLDAFDDFFQFALKKKIVDACRYYFWPNVSIFVFFFQEKKLLDYFSHLKFVNYSAWCKNANFAELHNKNAAE